jgi:uncharacterized protein YdeI (YjbR/CyaY-like superfamily)
LKPKFFATPSAFRRWLLKNHKNRKELLVGFFRKGSGKPSITWPESVDQALCFGWIDGVRKSVDGESYTIRFTPRKEKSHWSAINIRRAKELEKLGLMEDAGREAFSRRDEKNSRRASYERKHVRLDPALRRKLQSHRTAWAFFQTRPPYYRRLCFFWIMNAKREDTRKRRLEILVHSSEKNELVPGFLWKKEQQSNTRK